MRNGTINAMRNAMSVGKTKMGKYFFKVFCIISFLKMPPRTVRGTERHMILPDGNYRLLSVFHSLTTSVFTSSHDFVPCAYCKRAAPKSFLNVSLGKMVKFQGTVSISLLSIQLRTSLASGSDGRSLSLNVSNGAMKFSSFVTKFLPLSLEYSQ